ncbi:JmjC protein [Haematococcus lacustris]
MQGLRCVQVPGSTPGRHPIGLQPEGNLLLRSGAWNCRNAGLGALQVLSDALILELLGLLDAVSLCQLSQCSRALYCFCDAEDLWKALVLEETQGSFCWSASWRDSLALTRRQRCPPSSRPPRPPAPAPASPQLPTPLDLSEGEGPQPAPAPAPAQGGSPPPSCLAAAQNNGKRKRMLQGNKRKRIAAIVRAIKVDDFYSDLLYQPWHCATSPLPPHWLDKDNVDRRQGLTAQQFREQYEETNRPVVLSDGAADWPALRKWTPSFLQQAFREHAVIAGSFDVTMATYLAYAATTWDEMPLYLFDKRFMEACPALGQDFQVPSVFTEDLMGVMGAQRPDFRWLIAGPARSGSSFHIDPNATSAWNAVVSGRKKWVLYPPSCPPPGVHPSPDGAEVAAPVSLMEWFINFYDAAQEGKVQPLECVVQAGEVMFVPRGWWHACLNLDTLTVAVTQNFVSSVNLAQVLDFLRPGRAELVSGCSHDQRGKLHDMFVAGLARERPDLLKQIERRMAAARAKVERDQRLSGLFRANAGQVQGSAGAASNLTLGVCGKGAARVEAAAQPVAFSFAFNLA